MTGAETCELALALAAAGQPDAAIEQVAAMQHLRARRRLLLDRLVFADDARWPVERTTWTAAAVVLAADALSGATPASGLFTDPAALPGRRHDRTTRRTVRRLTRRQLRPGRGRAAPAGCACRSSSNTDLRWSCTVCADRNIRRGDLPGVAPGGQVAEQLLLALAEPGRAAEQREPFGRASTRSIVTAMSPAPPAASSRAARRVSHSPSARCTRARRRVAVHARLHGQELRRDVVGAGRDGRPGVVPRHQEPQRVARSPGSGRTTSRSGDSSRTSGPGRSAGSAAAAKVRAWAAPQRRR